MKRYTTAVTAIFFALAAYAQDSTAVWTLDVCIDHALSNNIQLKQDRLNEEISEADVLQSKGSLFPSLSFSTSHGITNRPFQEHSNTVSGSELITSDQRTTYSGNYSLNAQWTVWGGNKKQNGLRQAKNSREISRLTTAETENSLKQEIAQLYVQIIYSIESVAVNDSTCALSVKNLARGEELYAEGQISQADLAQLKQQVSEDRFNQVKAEGVLSQYILQLKQLLELDSSVGFSPAGTDIADDAVLNILPDIDHVYDLALNSRPEMQSSKLSIENSLLGIKIARSGYMPIISMNASTQSSTNSAADMGWGSQMKTGWNNVVGISLSIPIYDNHQTITAVKKAKLEYDNSRLEYESKQKELYKTIETLWLDANNAQQEFIAAKDALATAQSTFEIINTQFDYGMKNTIELLTEKNNYLKAQQQYLTAKYTAILNRALLLFYSGEPLEI